MSPDLLQRLLRQHAPTQAADVRAVRPRLLDSSASILANLTAERTAQPVGLFGLEAELRTTGTTWRTERLVLKAKPPGPAICQMLTSLARACGGLLAEVYPAFELRTGFAHTHRRELAVYGSAAADVALPPLLPTIWATHADEAAASYLVVLEDLSDRELLNSAPTPDAWTDAHLRAALRQLAAWHARHLAGPIPPESAPATWPELVPLWEALLAHAATHFPALYPPARVRQLRTALRGIPADWATLQTLPKTLIHNDLNPRNTCFKRSPDGHLAFVAYDWELAAWHLPQYDVVELLSFVLTPARYHLRPLYFELYRQELHALTGQFADRAAFAEGYRLASLEFGLHRVGLYLMAHTRSPYCFLPGVINSFFAGLTR
ncbi:phosphotransferase [Hymenobacter sp. HMF4947]|uniref:Phosphotransferase n=1 Tax=Hymenobacter ginkgonis TaxID=2682976 RepID=A0A7K1TFD4_9BACT|nr:aminoglycoside phosphotransferase family protein [Hymenobacter ginkgonis]MVN77120.1 phosphotransferase [Hymenobacter ginkgonis]